MRPPLHPTAAPLALMLAALAMKRPPLRRLTAAGLLLLALAAPARPAAGATRPPAGAAVAAAPAGRDGEGPRDPAELQAFLDRFFGQAMARYHVPGAAVAVVRDGRVLLARGYGLADVERQVPVDPERTVFSIASVSKTPAAVAALQLYEQGRLDLHAGVNRYLNGHPVTSPFPEPITVAHILTHTDGLPERNFGVFALEADRLPPTGAAVAGTAEAAALPPGRVITYGSAGFAWLGYLIEEVSGQPLDRYAEQNIFAPLGMRRTTFAQALPPELAQDRAVVYSGGGDGPWRPSPYLYGATPATGGLRTTAGDMARFMLALLGDGALDGQRILRPESVRLMRETQFAIRPGFPGATYGFLEHVENGRRGLVRDGSGFGVSSRLLLLPDDGVGLFVVQNAKGKELVEDLTRAFFRRYYPAVGGAATDPAAGGPATDPAAGGPATDPAAGGPATDPAGPARAAQVAGLYRYIHHSRRTFTKLHVLFNTLQVTAHADGAIRIRPLVMEDVYGGLTAPVTLAEQAPLWYRAPDGPHQVAFGADGQGRVTRLYSGMGYHGTYERIPWYLGPAAQFSLLGACLLISAAGLAGWGAWLIRRRRAGGEVRTGAGRGAARAAAAAALSGALNLGFLAAFYLFAMVVGSAATYPPYAFVGGIAVGLQVALALGIIAAAAAGAMAVLTVQAWRRRWFGPAGRWLYSLCAAGSATYVGFLYYWNLLGFRY